MGIETAFSKSSDSNSEQELTTLSPQEKELFSLLVERSQVKPIDPEDFTDLYKDVASDMAYVEKVDQSIEARELSPQERGHTRRGRLFEVIVDTQIVENAWLGPDAQVIKPSRFDDIVNKVDTIVEFEQDQGRSHLALAFDVTKGQEKIREKFNDVRRSIDEDKLTRVKYFKSRGLRGELSGFPRVIVGADQPTIANLINLVLEAKKNKDPKEVPRLQRRLENDPVQFQFLFEVKIQLEAFRKYAEKKGKRKAAARYKEVLAIIDAIINEKTKEKNKLQILSEIRRDEVFQMIIKEAESFSAEQ